MIFDWIDGVKPEDKPPLTVSVREQGNMWAGLVHLGLVFFLGGGWWAREDPRSTVADIICWAGVFMTLLGLHRLRRAANGLRPFTDKDFTRSPT